MSDNKEEIVADEEETDLSDMEAAEAGAISDEEELTRAGSAVDQTADSAAGPVTDEPVPAEDKVLSPSGSKTQSTLQLEEEEEQEEEEQEEAVTSELISHEAASTDVKSLVEEEYEVEESLEEDEFEYEEEATADQLEGVESEKAVLESLDKIERPLPAVQSSEEQSSEELDEEEEEELAEAYRQEQERIELMKLEAEAKRRQLIEQYSQAMQERQRLKLQNSKVQHKLSLFFSKRNAGRSTDRPADVEDADGIEMQERYLTLIERLHEMHVETKSEMSEWSKAESQLIRRCKLHRDAAESKWTELMAVKRAAMIGRTKNLKVAANRTASADEYMEREQKRWAASHEVNLEHIRNMTALQKLEKTLKDKEQVAEGLLMSDFEQMKMDNQGLNEKIEDMTETIAGVRRKLMENVQMITHIKEKLNDVTSKNQVSKAVLLQVDEEVAKKRIEETRIKKARDALRNDSRDLRDRSALLCHPEMLRDMERTAEQCAETEQCLNRLQTQHGDLSRRRRKLHRKIASLQEQKRHNYYATRLR